MSTGVDAYNAFGRLQELFEAETLPDELMRDDNLENALELDDVSFSWDAPPPEPEVGKGKGKKSKRSKKNKKKLGSRGTDASLTPASGSEKIFKFKKTSLKIPRGLVVGIVGPVGSGKSSLLQGLIGEMRKESGTIKVGGSLSYCAQNAWIQVRSPISLTILSRPTNRAIERHHPRKHLFRSTFRTRSLLASHLGLMSGCRLDTFPER